MVKKVLKRGSRGGKRAVFKSIRETGRNHHFARINRITVTSPATKATTITPPTASNLAFRLRLIGANVEMM